MTALRRNFWLALCAALFTCASLFAIPGLGRMADPESVYDFQFNLFYNLMVTDYETLMALTYLRPVILALAFLGPVLMAVLLWYAFFSTKGFRVIALGAKGLFWASCALDAVLGLLVLYRALRYAFRVIRGGVGILAVSMVIFEGIPVLLMGIVLFLLLKLFRRGEEAADMLYYITLSGAPDPTAVSVGLCVELYLAGLATIACGLLRLPDIPGALTFILCGCGDLLLGILLRVCRSRMERAKYFT